MRRQVRLKLLNKGCFPLCQRFRKFRSQFKWKGPFRFLSTGIFGITFGGGPLISVGIFRSKFSVPFLTNRFFALIREFGNDKKWQELFLIGWRGLIGKCRSIFLGKSHLSLTGRFGIMESNQVFPSDLLPQSRRKRKINDKMQQRVVKNL